MLTMNTTHDHFQICWCAMCKNSSEPYNGLVIMITDVVAMANLTLTSFINVIFQKWCRGNKRLPSGEVDQQLKS